MSKTKHTSRNPFAMLARSRKAATEKPLKGKGSFKRNPKHKGNSYAKDTSK